jgi:hypothetical protein
MRQVAIVVVAAVLAATVGACADPYYGYHRSYAYTSDYYYPNYYYGRPVYYSSAPYYGTYDYYRNYNGIHSTAEVSAM